jgi:hypothetical protein
MALGVATAVFGKESADAGTILSNRVLVSKMPRRPMPEDITPEQVRALPRPASGIWTLVRCSGSRAVATRASRAACGE